jgi:hypothetical protein
MNCVIGYISIWFGDFMFGCLDRQGHLSMVIQLLRYGADPSVADGEGYRSLHLAILFQHMPIAAYLMAKGQVRLLLSFPLSATLILTFILVLSHPYFLFYSPFSLTCPFFFQ